MERERNFLDKTRLETAIWASKLVLLVVGAISTATLFKVVAIPYLHNLALSTVPKIWASVKASSASPLYIYLAVNLIIAAIAVTSTFGHRSHRLNSAEAHKARIVATVPSLEKNNSWESFRVLPEETTMAEIIDIEEEEEKEKEKEKEDEKKEESWPPDSSSGGGGEEISSMDETWKAIVAANNGGLRRSETVVVERASEDEVRKWARKEMRKWETFNERVSQRRDEKKKPMTTDELSRRAEAFIKKVNDDMRLQRLESHQRLMDMVNRGL